MTQQLLAAFLISVLHGFIPGHWLPFLALAKKLGWNRATTLRYTGLAAIAHATGTVVIGLVISQFTRMGLTSTHSFSDASTIDSAGVLQNLKIFSVIPFDKFGSIVMVLLGIWFFYRHHNHHHFQFPDDANNNEKKWALGAILLALLFSPCMEIEFYFATLAPFGWDIIFVLVTVYSITTWLSMMAGVWIGFQGLKKWNSHKLEHSAGLVTGIVMIISGLFLAFT